MIFKENKIAIVAKKTDNNLKDNHLKSRASEKTPIATIQNGAEISIAKSKRTDTKSGEAICFIFMSQSPTIETPIIPIAKASEDLSVVLSNADSCELFVTKRARGANQVVAIFKNEI